MTDLLPAAASLADWLHDVHIPLTVRGVPMPCWRCGFDDIAIAVVHVTDLLDVDSVILASQDTPLAYARDILLRTAHPIAASIKVRRSKTAQQSYLSNGCGSCDALYGAFGLREDLVGMQANGSLGSLPVLAEVDRPEIEWVLLTAERDGLYSD